MATAEITLRATVDGTSVGPGAMLGSSGSYRLNSSYSNTNASGAVLFLKFNAGTPGVSTGRFLQTAIFVFPTSAHSSGVWRLSGSTSDTGIALLARCPTLLTVPSTNVFLYTTGSTQLSAVFHQL